MAHSFDFKQQVVAADISLQVHGGYLMPDVFFEGVLDHIVVAGGGTVSFAERGLL